MEEPESTSASATSEETPLLNLSKSSARQDDSENPGSFSYIQTLRFCLPFMKPGTAFTALVGILCVICILGAKVFHLVMGLFMKVSVDALSSNDKQTRQRGPLLGALLFLIGRIGVAIFTQGYEVAQEYYAQTVARKVAVHSFACVQRQSVDFHMNRRTGETVAIIRRGVDAVDTVLRQLVFWLLPTVVETIYVTIIFCTLGSPAVAVSTAVTVCFHAAFTARVTARRGSLARATRDAENDAWAHATERISHHATVRAFASEDAEVDHHDTLRALLQRASFVAKRLTTSFNVTADLILQVGTFVCFVFAARAAINGTLSVGDFSLAVTYVSALFWPLLVLAQSYGDVVTALANAEQLMRLLQNPNNVCDAADAIDLPKSPLCVEFDRVSFTYTSTENSCHGHIHEDCEEGNVDYDDNSGSGSNGGVHDISFLAKGGSVIALVGPSGAGKSTVTQLLLRLHDVKTGAVRVNGVDIREVRQLSLRSSIALVAQDTVLFNESIRDNVKYGCVASERCDVNDAIIWRALRHASLDSFVRSLPDGLDTIVGERGVRLSGGERQRVGIARAIIRDAPVVVLDEATSALSSLDEKAVQLYLGPRRANQVTVIVAHRLSTVRDADEILVMDGGRIMERGRHDSLLTNDGLYARMWRTQAGD